VSLDLRALERLTLDLWPAETRQEARGWVLTAGRGWVHRTNAVWPLAATGAVPLGARIAEAEAWYQARGLRPAFKITQGLVAPHDLPDALAARGYEPESPSLVRIVPVAAYLGLPRAGAVLEDHPGEAMRRVFAAASRNDSDRDERLAILARVPRPAAFAHVTADGVPVSCGMIAVKGRAALLAAMRTDPAHRRRGHARVVLGALAAFAAGQGADHIVMQVEEDNPPAHALYGPQVETVGRYATWVAGDRRKMTQV
jgi:GNAT superfamily N-acetyltransferase